MCAFLIISNTPRANIVTIAISTNRFFLFFRYARCFLVCRSFDHRLSFFFCCFVVLVVVFVVAADVVLVWFLCTSTALSRLYVVECVCVRAFNKSLPSSVVFYL